jgi:hypothetical protein
MINIAVSEKDTSYLKLTINCFIILYPVMTYLIIKFRRFRRATQLKPNMASLCRAPLIYHPLP